MTQNPNNNTSVLPWYGSEDELNSRKPYAYGQYYPLFAPRSTLLPFQVMREHGGQPRPVSQVRLLLPDGSSQVIPSLAGKVTVQEFPDAGYDVLVYTAGADLGLPSIEGICRLVMTDGAETWYSEQFTVVEDMSPYLKVEWWDETDLVTDFGRIVYSGGFRNRVYLASELAMPEYAFEEEGEDREGYFFPTCRISEKTYRFTALVPEYLADAIRIARLSDHVEVTDRYGRVYACDTFSYELEWQEQGMLASLDAEFQTDTVVKTAGTSLYSPMTQGIRATPGTVRLAPDGDYGQVTVDSASPWTREIRLTIPASGGSAYARIKLTK